MVVLVTLGLLAHVDLKETLVGQVHLVSTDSLDHWDNLDHLERMDLRATAERTECLDQEATLDHLL
jgi:hypothetical protein